MKEGGMPQSKTSVLCRKGGYALVWDISTMSERGVCPNLGYQYYVGKGGCSSLGYRYHVKVITAHAVKIKELKASHIVIHN